MTRSLRPFRRLHDLRLVVILQLRRFLGVVHVHLRLGQLIGHQLPGRLHLLHGEAADRIFHHSPFLGVGVGVLVLPRVRIMLNVREDAAENLRRHAGVVQSPVGAALSRDGKLRQSRLDADIIGQAARAQIDLEQIIIGSREPIGIVKLVHAGIQHDPLHILAAPRHERAGFALAQPSQEMADDRNKPARRIDVLLRNARLLPNEAVQLGKINRLDQSREFVDLLQGFVQPDRADLDNLHRLVAGELPPVELNIQHDIIHAQPPLQYPLFPSYTILDGEGQRSILRQRQEAPFLPRAAAAGLLAYSLQIISLLPSGSRTTNHWSCSISVTSRAPSSFIYASDSSSLSVRSMNAGVWIEGAPSGSLPPHLGIVSRINPVPCIGSGHRWPK
ncbi:hypothetical protein BN871_FZ_00040 [Paenibacillus sp. P22]|nr:hypothetical protein BN871_FZ_00040 [Paenibacillus sp. P22]